MQLAVCQKLLDAAESARDSLQSEIKNAKDCAEGNVVRCYLNLCP